jgi:thiol-disulfide isomerase/thioredoxin
LHSSALNFNTIKTLESKTYTIDNSKPILIHFWATWCPVCKTEASNIQTLSKRYQVITIAVKSGSNKEINNYLQEHHLNFKVYNDNDSNLSRKFNVNVFPTTFIYDKNKNLVFSEVGYTSTLGLYMRMLWSSLEI